jgi:hypothetical protein
MQLTALTRHAGLESQLMHALESLIAMKRTTLKLILAVILIQGCSENTPTDVASNTETYPGIRIELRDAASKLGIAEDAIAWIQESSYIDTLDYCGVDSLGNWLILCGAYERSGTYSLVIEKDRYITYKQDNISVQDDGRHVQTADLAVFLVRDVTVEVEVYPDTVQYGEDIEIHVFVKNNLSVDFIRHYPTTCQFGYLFYDTDDALIYFYPPVCGFALTTFELGPSETHEEIETINTASGNLTPGIYTLRAGLCVNYQDEVVLVVK